MPGSLTPAVLLICTIFVASGYSRQFDVSGKGRPHFVRRPEVHGIDCERLFTNGTEYYRVKRRTMMTSKNLRMTCEAVKNRVVGKFPAPALNYSIAFARNVYKNYEFVEFLLSMSYSSENSYCFAVDSKANNSFKKRIRQLDRCLPNVIVLKTEFGMDSAGHNTNIAHLSCMRRLLDHKKWKYLLNLQQNDILLHTNREFRQVFDILGGANIMETFRFDLGKWPNLRPHRLNLRRIDIFRAETPLSAEERKAAVLKVYSGAVQGAISREAAEWMTTKIDIWKLDRYFNLKSGSYGGDEFLLNSLQASETLKMPGGYHSNCIGKQKFDRIRFVIRVLLENAKFCRGGHWRHGVCILGVEHLPLLRKISPRHLFANKMLPEYDFSAVSCIAESIFHRTHYKSDPIDEKFFRNHAMVKYNRLKNATPGFDHTKFNCSNL